MTGTSMAMLFAVSYGIGTAAFLVLIALMILNRRPKAFGLGVLAVCSVTALWAAAAAIQGPYVAGVAHVLESVRSTAWLMLLASILSVARRKEGEAHIG